MSDKLDTKDIDTKIIKKLKNFPVKKKDTKQQGNVFYQTLISYFDDIIDNNFKFDSKITLFDYQKDALNSAIVKLNRYNGAILGDVVGLGKTIIAVGILKVLKYKSIIIAPPAVHKQWNPAIFLLLSASEPLG